MTIKTQKTLKKLRYRLNTGPGTALLCQNGFKTQHPEIMLNTKDTKSHTTNTINSSVYCRLDSHTCSCHALEMYYTTVCSAFNSVCYFPLDDGWQSFICHTWMKGHGLWDTQYIIHCVLCVCRTQIFRSSSCESFLWWAPTRTTTQAKHATSPSPEICMSWTHMYRSDAHSLLIIYVTQNSGNVKHTDLQKWEQQVLSRSAWWEDKRWFSPTECSL